MSENPFQKELDQLKGQNPFATELEQLQGGNPFEEELKQLQPNSPDKLDRSGFIIPKTDKRLPGDNLLRGVATGIVSEGILGTTDAVASIAQLASQITGGTDAIKKFRRRIAQSQEIVKRNVDAQGIEGGVGRGVGAIGSMLIGGGSKAAVTGIGKAFGGGLYGAAAVKVTARLAKMDNAIGTAAKLGINGTFVQRAMVNLIAGLPLDLIQVHTLPESDAVIVARRKQEGGIALTDDDESALDDHMAMQAQVLAFAMGTGAIGGALVEGGIKKLGQVKDAVANIRAGAPSTTTVADEIKANMDALLDLSKIATARKTSRKAASTAWNQGGIAVRKRLVVDLTDDEYALDFGKLPSSIKQTLSETFGGPIIGPMPVPGKTAPPEGGSATAVPPKVSPAGASSGVRAAPKLPAKVIEETEKIAQQLEAMNMPEKAAEIRAESGVVGEIRPVIRTTEESNAILKEVIDKVGEMRRANDALAIDPDDPLEQLAKVNPEMAARAKAEGWTKEKLLEELLIDVQAGQSKVGDGPPVVKTEEPVVEPPKPKASRTANQLDDEIDAIDDALEAETITVDEHATRLKSVVEERMALEKAKPKTKAESITTGFRGVAAKGTTGRNSEGEGMYVARSQSMAQNFAGEGGTVSEIPITLKKPLIVKEGEELPLLEESAVIFDRIKPEDSEWIKLNKEALQKTGYNPPKTDAEFQRMFEDGFPVYDEAAVGTMLTKLARQKGYDGFDIFPTNKEGGWLVIFDQSKVVPTGKTKVVKSKIKPTATMGKDLKSFNKDELMLTKRTLRSLLNNIEPGSADETLLKAEFARIVEFEAKRDGGLDGIVQMHPSVIGGVGGFFAGYAWPTDNPDERIRNAIIFGGLGLGGGIYAGKRWGPGVKRTRPVLPPWEAEIAKKVVSHDDIEKESTPLMLRFRQMEGFFVSRSTAAVQATKALGGQDLPTQRNFGRLFQMFGRWQARVESALIDGPSIVDDAGNIQWLDAKPLQAIANMVKGDSDRLGILMAARRALELASGKGTKTGIDLISAHMTTVKAAPEYHQAADETRKFNAALVDIADKAGLVFDRAKMSDVFYAPLNRIFGGKTSGGAVAKQTLVGGGKPPIGGQQPFKAQTGGTQLILNPFEATVDNLPRILKAAEMNELGRAFVELLDAADPSIAKHFGKRLHGPDLKNIDGYEDKVFKLKQELGGLGGKLSHDEAKTIAETFSDEALTVKDDILRVLNKGRVEQIHLNPELAKAFRSLNPEEMSGLFKFIGLTTKIARTGIVNDPFFIARQAFRDNWQAWLNTEYGFLPGISQVNGWFNQMIRSPAFKEYLAGGGGYGGLAEQRFAKGVTALPDVLRAPVKNALDQTVKEIREMHPLRAYQTLTTPVIEAARVGEYLRARGAGASVIDGVYAAKHVTGNFPDIGTGMRGAGAMVLFLNPAIKSLAQSARSFRRDPIAYLTKAFVGIALPSWYFWNRYQNDEELNQLRQTETGRRYWWTRGSDGKEIIKIPRPIFDGQLFGSTVETVLDRMKLQDPESMALTVKSVMNDVYVNLLPQIGVVTYSLMANKDLSSGIPIIPERVEGVDPQYQSGPGTTGMARVVGKEVGVAPSQIDFAVRNTFGSLGINAVRLISQAVEYQETGFVPPREELPGFESVFGRYPSMNVGAIREFYRNAGKVDEAAKTLSYAAQHDAENVEAYINSNMESVSMIELYKEGRTRLAELRAGVEQIRLAPAKAIPPQDKRTYIDELFRAMIATAKGINDASRAIKQGFKNE